MIVIQKLIILLLFICSNSAVSKDQFEKVKMDKWNFLSTDRDVISKSPLQRSLTTSVMNDNYQLLFISKEYSPVSKKNAEKVMEKLKGKNLKVLRRKNSAIFVFEQSPKQFSFLSTKGGFLQLNLNYIKDKKEIKKIFERIEI